jgi:hypothetical protein
MRMAKPVSHKKTPADSIPTEHDCEPIPAQQSLEIGSNTKALH